MSDHPHLRSTSPRRRARAEQDYWLSWGDSEPIVAEGDREEFHLFDSRGGRKPVNNLIYQGKQAHGRLGEMYKHDFLFSRAGEWMGGLELYALMLTKKPFGLRSLREWFGEEPIRRWGQAYRYEWARGWRPVYAEEPIAPLDGENNGF